MQVGRSRCQSLCHKVLACYADITNELPDSSRNLPAGIQIHHGQSVALPVITTAATAWHGMFVRKQTADGRLLSQEQQVAGHNSQRNRLSFLHIQLEGQHGSCGPLLLETLVTTRFEVDSVHSVRHSRQCEHAPSLFSISQFSVGALSTTWLSSQAAL